MFKKLRTPCLTLQKKKKTNLATFRQNWQLLSKIGLPYINVVWQHCHHGDIPILSVKYTKKISVLEIAKGKSKVHKKGPDLVYVPPKYGVRSLFRQMYFLVYYYNVYEQYANKYGLAKNEL